MVYLNNISYLEEYLNKYPDAYVDLESMCPRDPLPDCDRHHNEEKCRKCWFREVPTNSINGKALDEFNKIGNPNAVSPKDIRKVIKDSGDRTKFDTGAVRDMHEGKGRCDIMPLEVIARYLDRNYDKQTLKSTHSVFEEIAGFQKDRNTDHLYNAINLSGVYTNCFTMFLEVAKHFEEGAKKYGESNYKLGIPTWCYIDSAIRHYIKFLRGDTDEPHDRAFIWNLMCCIWEVDYHKEVDNKCDNTHEDT